MKIKVILTTIIPPYGFNEVACELDEEVAKKIEKKEKVSDEEGKSINYLALFKKKEQANHYLNLLTFKEKVDLFEKEVKDALNSGNFSAVSQVIRTFFNKNSLSDDDKLKPNFVTQSEYDSVKKENEKLKEKCKRLEDKLNNVLKFLADTSNTIRKKIETNDF